MLKDIEFMRGISLEENPFENETPAGESFYDLSGNEVSFDVAE